MEMVLTKAIQDLRGKNLEGHEQTKIFAKVQAINVLNPVVGYAACRRY
jgi:hypothetical protein